MELTFLSGFFSLEPGWIFCSTPMIVSDIDGVRVYEDTGLHFDQTDIIDVSKVKKISLTNGACLEIKATLPEKLVISLRDSSIIQANNRQKINLFALEAKDNSRVYLPFLINKALIRTSGHSQVKGLEIVSGQILALNSSLISVNVKGGVSVGKDPTATIQMI